jgi:hypothetical protein
MFHENPSSGSRVVPWGRDGRRVRHTYMTKLTVAFRNFGNVPKNDAGVDVGSDDNHEYVCRTMSVWRQSVSLLYRVKTKTMKSVQRETSPHDMQGIQSELSCRMILQRRGRPERHLWFCCAIHEETLHATLYVQNLEYWWPHSSGIWPLNPQRWRHYVPSECQGPISYPVTQLHQPD